MKLDILVENMGRMNFGHPLFDRKGITDKVTQNFQKIKNWKIYKLHFLDLDTMLPELIRRQEKKDYN